VNGQKVLDLSVEPPVNNTPQQKFLFSDDSRRYQHLNEPYLKKITKEKPKAVVFNLLICSYYKIQLYSFVFECSGAGVCHRNIVVCKRKHGTTI
jgi:hypothetical protein